MDWKEKGFTFEAFEKDCLVSRLIGIFESRGIPYYQVVRDDEDIPRALHLYKKEHGEFQTVLAIGCPGAVSVNKRFIYRYWVSVLFISLNGWDGCEIQKALKGKWWGETSLEVNRLKIALSAIH